MSSVFVSVSFHEISSFFAYVHVLLEFLVFVFMFIFLGISSVFAHVPFCLSLLPLSVFSLTLFLSMSVSFCVLSQFVVSHMWTPATDDHTDSSSPCKPLSIKVSVHYADVYLYMYLSCVHQQTS